MSCCRGLWLCLEVRSSLLITALLLGAPWRCVGPAGSELALESSCQRGCVCHFSRVMRLALPDPKIMSSSWIYPCARFFFLGEHTTAVAPTDRLRAKASVVKNSATDHRADEIMCSGVCRRNSDPFPLFDFCGGMCTAAFPSARRRSRINFPRRCWQQTWARWAYFSVRAKSCR